MFRFNSPIWHKRVTSGCRRLDHSHSEKLVKGCRNDNVRRLQNLKIIGSVFERTKMNDPSPESRSSFSKNFRHVVECLTEDGDFEVESIVVHEAEENFEKRFRIFVMLPTVRPDNVQRVLPGVSLCQKKDRKGFK